MFKPIAMLLLIAVSTAGCATERLARNDCDWAQPIRPSRKDVLTRQTKEQIAATMKLARGSAGGSLGLREVRNFSSPTQLLPDAARNIESQSSLHALLGDLPALPHKNLGTFPR